MSDDDRTLGEYYQQAPIPKPEPRCVSKRRDEKQDASDERECRRLVKRRDKHTCVVPNCREFGAHMHHIVYRSKSARLKWHTSNNCLLCQTHHELEHAHVIRISGNADEEVMVTGDIDRLRFRL